MADIIKVIVIARSPRLRCLFSSFLNRESDINVVGTAEPEDHALILVKALKPDVIAISLSDGLNMLDNIMHEYPTPIVAAYSTEDEANLQTQARELGAIDFIQWDSSDSRGVELLKWQVTEKVRSASRIRVIRSLRSRKNEMQNHLDLESTSHSVDFEKDRPEILDNVIVIGASTGGPTALRAMLKVFPTNFTSCILIVQHMPEGYTNALASQLNDCTNIFVQEAKNGNRIENGTAFVAPGDWHLLLDADHKVRLTRTPAVGGHRPSVDVTMQSVAELYGRQAIGVVLTGMGSDGAIGLQAIHDVGGITFAQESNSCVVDGMPKCAREAGVVDYIATPIEIAQQLASILK